MRIGIQNRFSDYGRGAMTAAPTTSSATNTLANQVSSQSLNTVGSSKPNLFDPTSISQQALESAKRRKAEDELKQVESYFAKMQKAPQTYSPQWLKSQLQKKIISTNVYRMVMAKYEEWQKSQPQLVQAAPNLADKSQYWVGKMDKNSLAYIDSLPEILGFRFDPNLYVESGHLAPLVGDNVPVEYELAYMQNIEKSLQDILDLFKAPRVSKSNGMSVAPEEDVYLQIHGASKPDGTLNPYFYSNFYYNLLGVDEDADGWPLKRGNFELGTVGTEEMMLHAPQRLGLAQVGVQSIMASMQALQAQAEELAVQEQELVLQQAQLAATASQPPAATEETKASWLDNPTNQIIAGVGGLAAAFALYKMFSK